MPPYFRCPQFLLDIELPQTAKFTYILLLDRATLSQKNGWVDERGFVFVCYPLAALAEHLHCSTMSVKRALLALETAGLLERRRGRFGTPNRIFIRLPVGQNCSNGRNRNVLQDGTKQVRYMERLCSPNQLKNQSIEPKNNTGNIFVYSYEEGESL